MGICPKLQNKRKTETGDPSFRAWEERGQWITLSWHSVGICPALGVDSMYLCFMCSGSFHSTLEELQEVSFCLLSWAVHSPHQLLLIMSQNMSNRCQKRALPYIICERILLPNKIQGSCTRTPKQLPQRSPSIWTETCCAVFGAQLFPLICVFLLFAIGCGLLNRQWNGQIDQAIGVSAPLWHRRPCECQGAQASRHPGTALQPSVLQSELYCISA